MPVIYLDKHRRLTKEQKEMASILLSNEINDVMADLEIIDEVLDKTFLFGDLELKDLVLDYMSRQLNRNPDGTVDEKVLERVYRWYFPE